MREVGPIGVQGALTQPVRIENKQKGRICGVKFTAYGLSAFTDLPAVHFRDDVIDARAIWGNAAQSLQEALCTEQDSEAHCDHIEAFLLQHLISRPDEDEAMRRWLDALASGTRIVELQQRYGTSQRKLHDLFDRRVGVRPKLFLRIERFASTLPRLAEEASLSRIAHDQAYSDQAHMTREFKYFAERSPHSLPSTDDEPHHLPVANE